MRIPVCFAALIVLAASAFAGVAEDNAKLPDYAAFHALLKGKKEVTWVITGDSITHGAKHTNGWRCYPEHFNERVRWELGRKNDVFINTGVSGEITDGLLKAFDFRVARFKPDFVSINLGMNDCGKMTPDKFRANLLELVKRVRALGAVPVLQVPNTVLAGNNRGPKLPPFCAVVREVAAQEKVLLVDHRADWEKAAGFSDAPAKWMNDPIHPNGVGQAEMAKTMFRNLGIFDPKSATCRLGDK